MRKPVAFVSIFLVLGAIVCILPPRSRPVDSPFVRQISAMQQICLKFRDYRYDHPNLTAEGVTRRSVAEYVSTGILSSNDATYIREHNIVFHGFDPSKIAGDVPVLEAIYSNGHLQLWATATLP